MDSGHFDSPAVRVPRAARRLVLVSGVPVAKRVESHDTRELPLTVPDAASTAIEHYITGSPVDSDHEISDRTASVDFTSDVEVSTQEEVDDSTFSDVTESVAGGGLWNHLSRRMLFLLSTSHLPVHCKTL